MEIIIEDKATLDLLNEKNSYSHNNLELIKQLEEIKKIEEAYQKNYQKNIHKMQRLDEKAKPKILKLVKGLKLNEFEELSRVYKDEKTGKWTMQVVDRLEEFKIAFKKK